MNTETPLSNCCDANMFNGMCEDCKEHCSPYEPTDEDKAYDEMKDMTSEDEYLKQEQRKKDVARLTSVTTELLNLVHRNEDTLLFTDAKNAVSVLLLFANNLEDEN